MRPSLLIVEDEPAICEILHIQLEREGFDIIEAGSLAAARAALREHSFALIVLDLRLPDGDGLDLCRELRARNDPVPVLILTARSEEIDKILGLELGADDYMTKPFHPRELVARVRAILRRSERAGDPVHASSSEELVVDERAHVVRVQGKEIELTPREFDVLTLLVRQAGKALTRDEILDAIWGESFVGDTKAVDVYIRRLREKIEPDPHQPKWIETVWGVGYRFQSGSK